MACGVGHNSKLERATGHQALLRLEGANHLFHRPFWPAPSPTPPLAVGAAPLLLCRLRQATGALAVAGGAAAVAMHPVLAPLPHFLLPINLHLEPFLQSEHRLLVGLRCWP